MILWQSIADQGIEDEDDLPPSIRMQLEETPNADATQDEGKI
jgi:hypothetical protein